MEISREYTNPVEQLRTNLHTLCEASRDALTPDVLLNIIVREMHKDYFSSVTNTAEQLVPGEGIQA